MRNRQDIFAFCAVLLLLPVFLEANAQAYGRKRTCILQS